MSWHYVLSNESKGPVEQSEIDSLLQQGVPTDATLVWREGMANWALLAGMAIFFAPHHR